MKCIYGFQFMLRIFYVLILYRFQHNDKMTNIGLELTVIAKIILTQFFWLTVSVAMLVTNDIVR